MKKVLLLSTALVCAPCTAFAAPPTSFNWTGFYVGVHGGYGWGEHHVADDNPTVAYEIDPDGFLGGAQVGFDYQFGNFVVGIEGDASWGDMSARANSVGLGLDATVEVDYLASLRARLGYSMQSLLIYATGGAAWAQFTDANFFGGGTPFGPAFDHGESGWTIGLGAEFPLGPKWMMKVDYLHYEFDSVETTAAPFWGIGRDHFDTEMDSVRVGVNFRF